MSSSKEYLNFILGQLSELEGVTHRQMMGEYIIYYKGKIALEICDNRLLAKPVKSARELMPNAALEPPYKGAKEMLVVDNPDDMEFLQKLLIAMYDELPTPKPKKKTEKK